MNLMMKGILLTLLGGALWGFSGLCSQFIQQDRGVDAGWLIMVRLLLAGSMTILYGAFKLRGDIFDIFDSPKDTFEMIIFGILGIALCQYTYMKSILYAGAGIATVLQYLGPGMIIVYLSLRYRKLPRWNETISVILATLGTAVIALQGTLDVSGVDERVLFWGILSAVGVAIYSAQPVQILRKYGTTPVVGWGMLFGGIVMWVLVQPKDYGSTWDIWTYGAFWSLTILGSIVSFNAYLEGVRIIGAVKGSILSSIEPISAAFLGWAVLGNQFSMSDAIGFLMILATIFILSLSKGNQEKAVDS